MGKPEHSEVVLIGAGIMSATLGMMLKELDPGIRIHVFERLPEAARESSDAWNNAGTGHSAFCELNYTPQKADGSVDVSKAVKVASSFEMSREFWSHLIEKGRIDSPKRFIHRIPHMSFVWGENVPFLRKRYAAMSASPLFSGMNYSEDWSLLSDWMPLVMQSRAKENVAATRMDIGTDVDFGSLTRAMLNHLLMEGVDLHMEHEVRDIVRHENGQWNLTICDLATQEEFKTRADFVFIGAGGGSLTLLGKSDIPEADGFAGFPVSGQWLKCTNQAVVDMHQAKVYGKASVGSPPMSVPHLDTRMIGGKKALLFGPYAGFTTKFLKKGSYLDLAASLELENIFPMLSAGMYNLPLTKYLIQQALQTPEDRIEELRVYLPDAKIEDWELAVAGQRVQVIRADEEKGGVLEFGTEIVSAKDGSLSALLGASPGASTSVSIILEVLQECFPAQMASNGWKKKLKEMIPTYGENLAGNAALVKKSRARTASLLELD